MNERSDHPASIQSLRGTPSSKHCKDTNSALRQRLLGYLQQRYSSWLDAASLSLLLTTALVAAYATCRWFGMDFRVYFGAARLVLQGGNPYDYQQLAPVLFELDGKMGVHPFYYAPWWALVIAPLAAWLTYAQARVAWLGLNLLMGWGALLLSQRVLDWQIRPSTRRLAFWSALYLLGWLCLRHEQCGIFLYAVLVLVLWGLQRKQDWLVGSVMPLLLIKPHITLVPIATLVAVFWFRGHRRALLWAGISLIVLLLVSSAAIPGWWEPILRGNLPNALTRTMNTPQQVTASRILTTLPDWLKHFGLSSSAVWIVWGGMVVVGIRLLIWAWQRETETAYLVALAVVLGLAITPYAVQYDYVLMTLVLLWAYRQLPLVFHRRQMIGVLILAFAFSVPIWEKWMSDGYWLTLALGSLLIVLAGQRPHLTSQGTRQ